MNKIVKAVKPYIYPQGINFKFEAFQAWRIIGGSTVASHYPPKRLHGIAFRYEFPTLYQNKREARLRFVQPWSISFDTFPDYITHEVIPFIWDVWPDNIERIISWIRIHHIKTAVFTSSQATRIIKERFPLLNVCTIHEGINTDDYCEGKLLKDRNIDFLEYGRNIDKVVKYDFGNLSIIRGQKDGKNLLSTEDLKKYLQNAKIAAAYPKNWTDPQNAGDIETLTQRYWECMLSRCLMIGHAPKELNDLIGYNPVIEVDTTNPDKQLFNIIDTIDSYQGFVDKNREVALIHGNWVSQMEQLRDWLNSVGYNS